MVGIGLKLPLMEFGIVSNVFIIKIYLDREIYVFFFRITEILQMEMRIM